MSNKVPDTNVRSMEEERDYHSRYLRAINNPLRREILKALKEGSVTFSMLQSKMELDENSLKWHLNILENGFCIKKERKNSELFYKLTKEGLVIDYLQF